MTSRLNSVRLAAALALAAGFTVAHADDAAALAAAAKEPGAVVLPSGVVFKSMKEGSGANPKASDTVKVNYRGTFPDGKEFDASRGNPISFPAQGRRAMLDGRRAEAQGGRQGQADLPVRHGLRPTRRRRRDPAERDARVRGRAARHQLRACGTAAEVNRRRSCRA